MLLWLSACAASTLRTIEVPGGGERSYYVTIPKTVQERPAVVFVFHGGGGDDPDKGRRIGRFTGFDKLAEKEGFVAVYPNSVAGNWNDGRPEGPDTEDVAFVDAMVELLREELDPSAFFTTGISNGAFFSSRLACERTDVFSAFAGVVGSMAAELECEPSRPIPAMYIAGTEDPLVPFEGGQVATDKGLGLGFEEVADFWVAQDGCTEGPAVSALPDTRRDGVTAEERRWTGCTDGVEVRLIVAAGMGHTWPGGSQYLPKGIIGPVGKDFAAEELIWAFFDAVPRGTE